VDLTLYRVGASGRVNLGDLAKDVEFYTVSESNHADGTLEGTLVLTPVRVVSPSTKRAAGAPFDEV